MRRLFHRAPVYLLIGLALLTGYAIGLFLSLL